MIRCKCGTWTDYGMTCVACRSETYRNMRPPTSGDGEGVSEPIDTEEEEDEFVEWDDWTDSEIED